MIKDYEVIIIAQHLNIEFQLIKWIIKNQVSIHRAFIRMFID